MIKDQTSPPSDQTDKIEIKAMSLADLVTSINACHAKIVSAGHNAKLHAMAALEGSIQMGKYLIEAKVKAEQGKWLQWLKEFCPDLPSSTAHRYMALAEKFPLLRNQDSFKNLTAAYIACGVLPDPAQKHPKSKKEPETPSLPSVADFIARVRSLREFLTGVGSGFNTEACATQDMSELGAEISRLVATFEEVRARLSNTGLETKATTSAPRVRSTDSKRKEK